VRRKNFSINPGDQLVTEGMPGLSDGVAVLVCSPLATLVKPSGQKVHVDDAGIRR
jgi:hypothetical protein